ncbi:MAG: hypothetical protein IPK13_28035 [Deltaproteobacteria bacterium]|nr:hypothetical protein [Deltaproteobacteria bacterium]
MPNMKYSPTSRLHRFACLWMFSIASAGVANLGGCVPEGGPNEHGPSLSPSEWATTQSALTTENSLAVNGLLGNGMYVNGLAFNSNVPNGLYVNGLPLNGLPLNGLYVNGLYVNGISYNGLPLNGLPLNGLYVNGLPLNGLPLNGLPLNGLYVNGLPLNGLYVNGLPVNGLPLNGLPLNGLYVNGLPLNGLYVNGLYPNGLYVNGLPLNGLPLNGLYVNGTAPATAIKIASTSGQLVNLSSNEEAAFESVIGHLVWCALPQGQSLTIYRSTGEAKVYPGYHNLAPTWKTNALVDSPTGIDDSEELRWCVEHYRPVTSGNQLYVGLALNAQQQADLEKLLKYAIECALEAGDSVSVTFPSGAKTFNGALGLAPIWKTGALDTTGQKAVSACLAARTNALGNTVRISLRNPAYAGLDVSPAERESFTTHEGAFWGNVFGTSPQLHACKDEGGGPAGRLCTDGHCGFSPDPLPPCSNAALGGCDTQDADKNWTSCGTDNESVVLNTFLMTEEAVAFGYSTTCVTPTDNTVQCWGNGNYGNLGDGTTNSRAVPGPVVGLPDPHDPLNVPKELSLSGYASCARLRGGTLWCWGDNSLGSLGDGTRTTRLNPVYVAGLGNQVARTYVFDGHACALKMDGTLWCWGANDAGALGDGSYTDRLSPVRVGITELGNQAIQVGGGRAHTCVLKMDGTVWCSGYNDLGALGDGTTTTRNVYAQAGVTQLASDVVQLVAGGIDHACAVKADRTLWCWGLNSDGQLGDGTTTTRHSPVQAGVSQLGNQVLRARSGVWHTCAIKTDGTVWCWGYNYFGQLGDGTTTTRKSPVQVPLPGPARVLQPGHSTTFVTLLDGSTWGWGYNGDGQLGDGTTTDRRTPVRMTAFVTSGDGKCETTESTIYEAGDCGAQVCGDGFCAGGETCASCAADCPIPTYYLDADGDGFGTPNITTVVCGDPSGYVTNGSDCNDSNAAVKPGATEVLDGIDNDCDAAIDEGLNLLSNPSFTTNLTNWTASTGTLARTTTNCKSAGGCAKLTTTTSASINEGVGAVGAGTYSASAWVRKNGTKGTITAYVQIEERTAGGALVGTTNGTSKSAGKTYLQISASRTVTAPTNTVKLKVVKTAGSPMLLDDVSLVR